MSAGIGDRNKPLTVLPESISPQSKLTSFHQHKIFLKVLPVFICTAGITVIAWAWVFTGFRDQEGFLTGAICLPLSVGLALMIAGWAIIGQRRRFALWLSLALVGQAVALQMIDAGKLLHYQHYRPLIQLILWPNLILLLFLGAQAVIVILGFATRWIIVRKWVGFHFKYWQLFLLGFVFFLSSATVSENISFYIGELFFASFVQLINLGNIVLLVWTIPDETLASLRDRFSAIIDRLTTIDDNRSQKSLCLLLIAFLWVVLISAFIGAFSYEKHPHLADEVAYLYQARYLAKGEITAQAPPAREAFELYLMQFDGDRWYPATPPGWPAILAIGALFGVPWLVNPFLAGLNIVLVYYLIRKLYSYKVAWLAVALLCLSPWYIFMAMNFMTHTLTLTCALISALGVIRSRETGHARWTWLAGFALGAMSLIRPLESFTVAVLLGFWSIGVGGQRLKISSIASLVLGAIVVGSLTLPYNKYLTGNATIFPLNAYTDQVFGKNSNSYGFGPDRGMGWAIDPNPGHSPIDGMINANLNIYSLNIELFGWGVGSLLLIALFVLSGKFQKSDYLMAAVIIAIFTVFFFYYFSGGPDFGARYWYLMVVPLVVLTVRGIQTISTKLVTVGGDSTLSSSRVIVGVFVLSLLAVFNFFPWRAIDKYHHYLNMRPDIHQLAEKYNFGRSLVLVRGDQLPDYASAAVFNPVDMASNVPIYAWDRDLEARNEVLEAYADRTIWIVNGPTLTGRGYELVAGPLRANNLLISNVDP